MAELRYEAPLATFDLDEWNEFLDLQSTSGVEGDGPNDNSPVSDCSRVVENRLTGGVVVGSVYGSAVDGFDDESLSGSLEDLVNTFDERITKCFKNYNDQVEAFAPVQVRSETEITNSDSQMWWTLTGNFGNILPINWAAQNNSNVSTETTDNNNITSCRRAPTDTKSSCDGVESEDDDDDSDDDDSEDEGAESSRDLSTTGLDDEPVMTADEVISEIECMLEGSPATLTPNGCGRTLSSSVSAELRAYMQGLTTSHDDNTTGLSNLSLRALCELKAELDSCVAEHSEVLVQELALRDDLEYEKELKNQFIWLLLTVQKRRREAAAQTELNNHHKLARGSTPTVATNCHTNNNAVRDITVLF